MYGLCTNRLVYKKVLRIYRLIRDLICGALEVPLVVIQLGITGPKKTGLVCLLDFSFESQITSFL